MPAAVYIGSHGSTVEEALCGETVGAEKPRAAATLFREDLLRTGLEAREPRGWLVPNGCDAIIKLAPLVSAKNNPICVL